LTTAAAPGQQHTVLLCIFGPLGLAVIAAIRATAGLKIEGTLGGVAYVVTFATGIVVHNLANVWTEVRVPCWCLVWVREESKGRKGRGAQRGSRYCVWYGGGPVAP
jgi:hypothetical protein